MNGIGLLVLISIFGQAGQAAPPAAGDTERDFGWQISPEDNALEYIVQLSNAKVAQMQTGKLENQSDMPPQLVGRVTRVVVRIGNDVLPRTPSLAEIDARMPRYNSASDLSAALGPGRVSDVESNSMLNVQNGGIPPLPFPGRAPRTAGSPPAADGNVIDNAARAGTPAPSQLGTDFLSNSRNELGGTGAGGGFNTPAPPLPGTSTPGNKFNNTADLPSTTAGGAAGLPGNAATGPWQNGSSDPRMADNRGLPNYSANPSATNQPLSNDAWQSYNDPLSLDTRTPAQSGFGVPPRGQMPGRSLDDAIRQNQNSYPGNYADGSYGQNGYADTTGNGSGYGNAGGNYPYPNQSQMPGRSGYGGNGTNGVDLIAANPPTPAKDASGTSGAVTKSPSDDPQNSAAGKTSRSGDNFLQVFFLLSLVVNFYLGMLIRKLLTRYRSLLSSVRSQTA